MKNLFYIAALSVSIVGCTSTRVNYEFKSIPIERKKDSVKVAANIQYDNLSKSKRVFRGDHFRKEWATPVTIEVFNLDSLHEKLTPTRMGGGNQTQSLRLESTDGTEYVLRSVNKDPSKALPQEFVGTFADDIVQDQISSSNPYAPLVVSELAETAEIFHTNPKIVYVDSAKLLGEYNSIFANTVCLLEERPSGNKENNPEFGYSKNIVNTEKLFEKLRADKDHAVDQKAFLKARLFDMWIGDWDRHEDQWVWASFKENGKTIYRPIPRDRDQAFVMYDGLLPQIAARKWAVRRTQNFDYTIRDINGLNMSGNALDRMFTNELNFKDWEEITHELQQSLTDESIEQAFNRLPIEVQHLSSSDIINKLKRRRNDLHLYAHTYYNFLSEEVNILGSNKAERFEVNRWSNDITAITVYELSKKGEKKDTVFHRTFFRKETKEIRLYGFNDDDLFYVEGSSDKTILVRIMGGEGNDFICDHSRVSKLTKQTIIYDADVIVDDLFNEVTVVRDADSLKTSFNHRGFKYNWLAPKITPGFNPDDGLYIGGGFTFKKHQFGKSPYSSVQSFWGNHALATGAYNFLYEALFKELIGQWDLGMLAKLNAPNAIYNYYGLGNETINSNGWNYYRVRMNQFILNPSLIRQYHNSTFKAGLNFSSVDVEETSNRFVSSNDANLDSTAYDRKYFACLQLAYSFSTIDNNLYPTKGIKLGVSVDQNQNLKEDKRFTKLNAELSCFRSISNFTIAYRVGGSTILNKEFEFYQASTLGGVDNLRGYRRTRFAGQLSVYQNIEGRIKLNQINGYVWRGTYGLLAFVDAGRVWTQRESSTQWHLGYGAGFWYLPYDKISFTVIYSTSVENTVLNIKAGFLF